MEIIILYLKQFGVLILIGIVGAGLLGYGIWGVIAPEKATVEIIKNGSQTTTHSLVVESEIVIEVAGAVEKPGVYRLQKGSRIGDVLVLAGGVSENADREWVSKTMNLAEVVKDGGKVYIPLYRETPSQSNGKGVTLGESQSQGKININTASAGELDSLEGIGEVRAQAIVTNRPYANTQEIVEKAKIPQSVYEKIKDSITVY